MRIGKINVNITDVIIITVLAIFAVSIIIPFINAVAISFITENEYLRNKFTLFPKQPTLSAYQVIFKKGWVLTGYINSILLSLYALFYILFVNTLASYAITKSIPGKKFIYMFFLIPMYVSGGLIPLYIIVIKLGLKNNLLALFLPFSVSTYYILIMSTFFKDIPASLEESARLDGASEFRILWSIILPLSKPILATISLFIIVSTWNEWFYALLFLTKQKLWPLQLHLRRVINVMATSVTEGDTNSLLHQKVYAKGVQMASVVVTMFPIMVVYPFLQKYFAKGIMIGAVKG